MLLQSEDGWAIHCEGFGVELVGVLGVLVVGAIFLGGVTGREA